MNTKNVLIGMLAGVAAGAILGILFAPDKGSRTRRKLVDSGEDLTNQLKGKFGDITSTIVKKYNQTLKEAEALIEKGMELLPDHGTQPTTMNRDIMKEPNHND